MNNKCSICSTVGKYHRKDCPNREPIEAIEIYEDIKPTGKPKYMKRTEEEYKKLFEENMSLSIEDMKWIDANVPYYE